MPAAECPVCHKTDAWVEHRRVEERDAGSGWPVARAPVRAGAQGGRAVSTVVYRVEDANGVGPYQRRAPGMWGVDGESGPGPYGDFRWYADLDRACAAAAQGALGPLRFGFPTREAAVRWFGEMGLAILAESGFKLKAFRVPHAIVSDSGRQCLFDRTRAVEVDPAQPERRPNEVDPAQPELPWCGIEATVTPWTPTPTAWRGRITLLEVNRAAAEGSQEGQVGVRTEGEARRQSAEEGEAQGMVGDAR